MAAYDDQGKVAGLYTNQDLISSKLGIKSNDTRQSIIEKLGEPIKGIQKGLVMYQVQNNGEYNIYELDNSYITVFFDKHENDTVTALQIISKDLEQQKQDFLPTVIRRYRKDLSISSLILQMPQEFKMASRLFHGMTMSK